MRVTKRMSWLFRKKKSPIADEAKRNAEACKKALEIIRRCNSIGDKEIKQLAETLQPVNPDMDEDWFRRIKGMADQAYLSYVHRLISSGQKPSDPKKYFKEVLESQLRTALAAYDKISRSL
jgi:hypothetical protein